MQEFIYFNPHFRTKKITDFYTMQEATAQVANHSRPCSTLMLQALPALAKRQILECTKREGTFIAE
jgi:hypothetical protein